MAGKAHLMAVSSLAGIGDLARIKAGEARIYRPSCSCLAFAFLIVALRLSAF